MKIAVYSDLHTEFGNNFYIPKNNADIVILAGDIGTKFAGLEWAAKQQQRLGVPIIYVNGNHEYYNMDYDSVLDICRNRAEKLEINFLEKNSICFNGVRFLGTTLWTNFLGVGNGLKDIAMKKAKEFMTDYFVIRYKGRLLEPADTLQFNQESIDWLHKELSNPIEKTVVITHHGPSLECHSFTDHGLPDEISVNFWSNFEAVIKTYKPTVWVYGHTHSNKRFNIGGVPVITNQKGYPKEWVVDFQPFYIVEV